MRQTKLNPFSKIKKLEDVIQDWQTNCRHTYGTYVIIDNTKSLLDEPNCMQKVKICKVCKKTVGVIDYEC